MSTLWLAREDLASNYKSREPREETACVLRTFWKNLLEHSGYNLPTERVGWNKLHRPKENWALPCQCAPSEDSPERLDMDMVTTWVRKSQTDKEVTYLRLYSFQTLSWMCQWSRTAPEFMVQTLRLPSCAEFMATLSIRMLGFQCTFYWFIFLKIQRAQPRFSIGASHREIQALEMMPSGS